MLTRVFPKELFFLWQYAKRYPFDLVKACVAILGTALTYLSTGVVLGHFVDQRMIVEHPQELSHSLKFFLFAAVTISLATYLRTSTTANLGEKIALRLREKLFSHTLNLSHSFFESAPLGDLMSRMAQDIEQIRTFIASSFPLLVRNSIQLLGAIGLLIFSSTKLSLLIFVLAPLIIGPVVFLGSRVKHLTKEAQNFDGRAHSLIEEALSAYVTVKSFTAEDFLRTSLQQLHQDKRQISTRRTRFRSLMISSIIGLVFTAIILFLWFGIQEVEQGNLTAGHLMAFFFYTIVLAGSLTNLSEVFGETITAAGASSRLIDLLHEVPSIASPVSPRHITLTEPHPLHLDNIYFSYPYTPNVNALNGVSLTIEPGQKVALVGPSGSGKSTVFRLLLRFYDPRKGQITLDGIPTNELDLKDLRSYFSFVPQDPVLFHTSLFENIRYGQPDATDDQVLKAAQQAYVDEFVREMPKGYETIIGEKGVRLSGGQRQRIALARAILKDAPIFLLDEATNALDSQSEQRVKEALERILKKKTALIIAHRLATVQRVDKIVVFENGRVQDQGTHKQLLQSSSLYRDLAEHQFLQPK